MDLLLVLLGVVGFSVWCYYLRFGVVIVVLLFHFGFDCLLRVLLLFVLYFVIDFGVLFMWLCLLITWLGCLWLWILFLCFACILIACLFCLTCLAALLLDNCNLHCFVVTVLCFIMRCFLLFVVLIRFVLFGDFGWLFWYDRCCLFNSTWFYFTFCVVDTIIGVVACVWLTFCFLVAFS